MPVLADIPNEYKDKPFTRLSVKVEPEDPEGVRQFLKENKLSFPVHIDDGRLQSRMHVDTLPTAFFVDSHGHVRDLQVGAWGMGAMRGHIDELVEEVH
jgi:Redoxin.